VATLADGVTDGVADALAVGATLDAAAVTVVAGGAASGASAEAVGALALQAIDPDAASAKIAAREARPSAMERGAKERAPQNGHVGPRT
jgi:hypothetical protein